jgi:phage-related protein
MGIENADFVVTLDGILLPFGVYVSRESKEQILPDTREYTEEVPGRHGEYDFGSEFKPRVKELVCRTPEGLSPAEKEDLKRLLAYHLDPTKGIKTLVFEEFPEKLYRVKFSGKIEPKNYPGWFEFSIPLKMPDPYIYGTNERSLTGSGIAMNYGNQDTPVLIEISGPATNPSFKIGNTPHIFVGTINEGETVIIDTGAMTAKKGSTNVLAGFASAFASTSIVFSPGITTVSATPNICMKWLDKWI